MTVVGCLPWALVLPAERSMVWCPRWFFCVQDDESEDKIADRERRYFEVVASWNEG